MNKINLADEVTKRTSKRGEIRARINEYCRKEYGIQDFFEFAENNLYKFIDESCINICLGRQIPCINVEHLAMNKLANYLDQNGLPATSIAMSFTRDSFNSSNEYKMSLVKLQHLYRARNGKLVTQRQNVLAPDQKIDMDGKVLDKLVVESGLSLAHYHSSMREESFGEQNLIIDMSCFISGIAHQSIINDGKSKPNTLYIRNGTKEKKVRYCDADFSNGHDPRPPADWYYMPYLLLFTDGICALSSTVDEDPRVLAWFSENVKKIKEICGFAPLIIDTPLKVEVEGFSSKLNEIPKWISGNEQWRESIELKKFNDEDDLFHIVEQIEKQLIVRC